MKEKQNKSPRADSSTKDERRDSVYSGELEIRSHPSMKRKVYPVGIHTDVKPTHQEGEKGNGREQATNKGARGRRAGREDARGKEREG